MNVIGDEPILVSVNAAFELPVVPMRTVPRLKLEADHFSPTLTPVPERPISVGLLGSESVIVRVALLETAAFGVKVVYSKQLAEGARDPPQVELGSCLNWLSE